MLASITKRRLASKSTASFLDCSLGSIHRVLRRVRCADYKGVLYHLGIDGVLEHGNAGITANHSMADKHNGNTKKTRCRNEIVRNFLCENFKVMMITVIINCDYPPHDNLCSNCCNQTSHKVINLLFSATVLCLRNSVFQWCGFENMIKP